MSEIIAFPGRTARPKTTVVISQPEERERRRNEHTMHTFQFRSYDLIMEANEADLIRDVSLDLEKAQKKLRKIQERLQRVEEDSAAEIHLLTIASIKLSAAIVAALLSTSSKDETAPSIA